MDYLAKDSCEPCCLFPERRIRQAVANNQQGLTQGLCEAFGIMSLETARLLNTFAYIPFEAYYTRQGLFLGLLMLNFGRGLPATVLRQSVGALQKSTGFSQGAQNKGKTCISWLHATSMQPSQSTHTACDWNRLEPSAPNPAPKA